MLTVAQIAFIFELIEQRCGRGYSASPEVGKLQAMLSIMQEAAAKSGRNGTPIDIGSAGTLAGRLEALDRSMAHDRARERG
jgi:hypothetical protein